MFASSYNSSLVFFSVLVAILASFTALDMTARITVVEKRFANWWLAGGAVALGVGIWSMHFVGMLAFRLPIPLGYAPEIIFISLLIVIASSALTLWLVSRTEMTFARLCYGSLVMGGGISAMHYSGMAALRMVPPIHYEPILFSLSVLIAVTGSGVALWNAFHLGRTVPRAGRFRMTAAVVMGLAIATSFYVQVSSARIAKGSVSGSAHSGLDVGWLAILTIIVTLSIISIALIFSVLDMRMQLKTSNLASSLARANQELTYLALHDNLTKLPNRALMEDRLGQLVQEADREKKRFAIMFMDLDGFKAINDAFGHHIGDLLLIEAAERIREVASPQDTVARVGGDEFVLLTEAGEPAEAAAIGHRLVSALAQPFLIRGHEVRVSLSLGVALYPTDGDSQEDLLRNADAAMYHAKAQGRNGYCFFESSMNANVREQLQLLHDLRLAVERKELVLYYQPKFDVANQTILGAEALLRWKHPVRGMISPDEFIPLAERTGLIVPIGEWVLDEACHQMNQWRRQGHFDWTIAVNLSSLQFDHANLVQMVRTTLDRHGLDPCYLTLEITETTAMHDVDASMRILQQLSDMGVNISIDDFGRGYSSLLYLKRLPANELKIDRDFVNDLVHDSEDAAIVSAIVALGRTLNLKIVAEGVETLAQQEFLTHLGCNSLQGYLLGRPMPAELFSETAFAKWAPSGLA